MPDTPPSRLRRLTALDCQPAQPDDEFAELVRPVAVLMTEQLQKLPTDHPEYRRACLLCVCLRRIARLPLLLPGMRNLLRAAG